MVAAGRGRQAAQAESRPRTQAWKGVCANWGTHPFADMVGIKTTCPEDEQQLKEGGWRKMVARGRKWRFIGWDRVR